MQISNGLVITPEHRLLSSHHYFDDLLWLMVLFYVSLFVVSYDNNKIPTIISTSIYASTNRIRKFVNV